MSDIRHRIGVQGSDPSAIYTALTTTTGLAAWWTQETTGSGDLDGKLEFRFPPVGGFDMEVTAATPPSHVA